MASEAAFMSSERTTCTGKQDIKCSTLANIGMESWNKKAACWKLIDNLTQFLLGIQTSMRLNSQRNHANISITDQEYEHDNSKPIAL